MDNSKEENMNTGLLSIVNRDCKVIILGSFPGEESLLRQQYYASRTNDFWKLIGQVVGAELYNSSYDHKKKVLLDSSIGLWDVFKLCKREGSMDSGISETKLNDFSKLEETTPSLRVVCFNGKKAGKHKHYIRSLGYETLVLPSSSGANRRDMVGRLQNWLKLREYIS